MIGNPCNYFVNGSDREAFTYDGGPVLYHFCPRDSGLSTCMEMNVIFFAKDKEHAKIVLGCMLRFKLFCLQKYDKSVKEQQRFPGDLRRADKVRHLLSNHAKWKITLAPLNQFYEVGWACNDEV